jgi:TPR repeat protein
MASAGRTQSGSQYMSSRLQQSFRVLAFTLLVGSVSFPGYAQPDRRERSDELFNELFGEEVSTDEAMFREAGELWQQLADEGDASATYYLSFLYWGGLAGFRYDQAESLRLIRRSANAGHATAQSALANMYETGTSVERNEELAVEWWIRAAENGSWVAQSRLERAYTLGEIGLPVDREEAQRWRDFDAGE